MTTAACCEFCGKTITVIRFGSSAPVLCAACGASFEPPAVETDPGMTLTEEWNP